MHKYKTNLLLTICILGTHIVPVDVRSLSGDNMKGGVTTVLQGVTGYKIVTATINNFIVTGTRYIYRWHMAYKYYKYYTPYFSSHG